MQQLKDYSKQISEALEKILPKRIRGVIILGDPDTAEVSATSNMNDKGTISLMEEGISVIEHPDELDDLDESN